jgi:hypothetical protein
VHTTVKSEKTHYFVVDSGVISGDETMEAAPAPDPANDPSGGSSETRRRQRALKGLFDPRNYAAADDPHNPE